MSAVTIFTRFVTTKYDDGRDNEDDGRDDFDVSRDNQPGDNSVAITGKSGRPTTT